MSKKVSLIIVGDSISAHTAPFFDLIGIGDSGISNASYTDLRWHTPIHIDPAINDLAIGDSNRLAFERTGTDPVIAMVNASLPGTKLGSSGGATSGESYASVAIDRLLRPAGLGATPRLYILHMAYSNPTDSAAADAAARVVTWFAARKSAAASAGAELACMTSTLISRTDGIFDETTYRVAYNNIVKDATWQSSNGIYTADLTGISAISDVDAANNTTNFPDNVHPTFACLSAATSTIRSTVNQIISDHA